MSQSGGQTIAATDCSAAALIYMVSAALSATGVLLIARERQINQKFSRHSRRSIHRSKGNTYMSVCLYKSADKGEPNENPEASGLNELFVHSFVCLSGSASSSGRAGSAPIASQVR